MVPLGRKRREAAEAAREAKRAKVRALGSPLRSGLAGGGEGHVGDEVAGLAARFAAGKPFPHVLVRGLCEEGRMRVVLEEAKAQLRLDLKETDLFKMYQSCDMASLEEAGGAGGALGGDGGALHLLALRDALYAQEFRETVARVVGLPRGGLGARVDCSVNVYARGGHLLPHDDVIGTRRVAYVVYLTDPDRPWADADGGGLELYGTEAPAAVAAASGSGPGSGPGPGSEPASSSFGGGGAGRRVPGSAPKVVVTPEFNSMILFGVEAGVSFHAVAEVLRAESPRVAISGWYHVPEETPEERRAVADMIIAQDAYEKEEIARLPGGDEGYEVLPEGTLDIETPDAVELEDKVGRGEADAEGAEEEGEEEVEEEVPLPPLEPMGASDLEALSVYIAPEYLEFRTMEAMRARFRAESSLQLTGFLKADLAAELERSAAAFDARQLGGCGDGVPAPHLGPQAGGGAWEGCAVRGPIHAQRYVAWTADSRPGASDSAAMPQRMASGLLRGLFLSSAFARYIHRLTHVKPVERRGEVRLFRAGRDYTVAHAGQLRGCEQPILDCFLPCLVQTYGRRKTLHAAEGVVPQGGGVEVDSDGEEVDPDADAWADDSVGGYQSYIVADEDESNGDVIGLQGSEEIVKMREEDGGELLHVAAAHNTLALVLQDAGVLRFTKYVSALAPSSRWDVSVQFRVQGVNEDDVDDTA